jgi:hypothetical protein
MPWIAEAKKSSINTESNFVAMLPPISPKTKSAEPRPSSETGVWGAGSHLGSELAFNAVEGITGGGPV